MLKNFKTIHKLMQFHKQFNNFPKKFIDSCEKPFFLYHSKWTNVKTFNSRFPILPVEAEIREQKKLEADSEGTQIQGWKSLCTKGCTRGNGTGKRVGTKGVNTLLFWSYVLRFSHNSFTRHDLCNMVLMPSLN